jgi:Fic family protein
MTIQTSYMWKPIADLPGDPARVASPELRSLASVWLEQKDDLLSSGALDTFYEQLKRRWAIETGIIERVYALDRGVTELLIEKGVDASLIPNSATDKDPELVAAMIRDHQDALEGILAATKGERVLSTSYVKELHAVLARHQEACTATDTLGRTAIVPLVRGEYKNQPNNPRCPNGSVHEYCPPEQVASEMDRLIELHASHAKKELPPELQSAWLHHAFTQIHPFQDGNGRVARAIASLVLIRNGWFPLTITEDDRDRYMEALEAADHGNLKQFVDFNASMLGRTFVNALSIAGGVQRQRQVDHVIAATRELFEKRQQALSKAWEGAKTTANRLRGVSERHLEDIRQKLVEQLGGLSSHFLFRVDSEPNSGPRGHYFRHQAVQTAKQMQYYANLGEYHSWVRLVMKTKDQAEIFVSFHAIGHEYRGLLAATICFFRRTETEEGERNIDELVSVSDGIFQINYREDPAEAQARFEQWLDLNVVDALEIWRAGL